MDSVEQLLLRFTNEHRFKQLNNTELTSLIDEIGRGLQKLDSSSRYELLNSLYYNTNTKGYSSLLHLSFCRISYNSLLSYNLWRAIYIFCELGLNPMNCNYLPPNQIITRNSMKEQLNALSQVQEENEMKEMQTKLLTLRSQESNRSAVESMNSSAEFNLGDINEVFGDNDSIYIEGGGGGQKVPTSPQQQQILLRISPSHSKLKIQPRSWTELQLIDSNNNISDHAVTQRNIIEVLKYCGNYDNYQSPAIFTIYTHLASCCTILGNAFTSLKHFTPKMLHFALCKLPNSSFLSIVDNISYYDHLKMNKYEVDMKRSISNLKHNIKSMYEQYASRRFNNYLSYLFLLREFYNKFKKESWKRFMKQIYEPLVNNNNNNDHNNKFEIKDDIMDIIKMYTFQDLSYCDTVQITQNIENKWICIWFDSLNSTYNHDGNSMYNDIWINWICKNILSKLSSNSKQFLSNYLVKRGQGIIKNVNHYKLKVSIIDIMEKKLKTENFNNNDIMTYVNPKWFLNNIALIDTLLVQKLLICCVNYQNYKDLCVYALWAILTNAVFFVDSTFFDQIIQIIQNFSQNNLYFVNGCCQNILDSIFSVRPSLLQKNQYIQKNVATFLINLSEKNKIGKLSIDINKGLLNCCTSIPGNPVLLKIMITSPGLLDFQQCVDRGIINMINSRMQYVQDESIKNMFYSWYQYNTSRPVLNRVSTTNPNNHYYHNQHNHRNHPTLHNHHSHQSHHRHNNHRNYHRDDSYINDDNNNPNTTAMLTRSSTMPVIHARNNSITSINSNLTTNTTNTTNTVNNQKKNNDEQCLIM